MAAKLKTVANIVACLLLASCSAPWSSGHSATSPTQASAAATANITESETPFPVAGPNTATSQSTVVAAPEVTPPTLVASPPPQAPVPTFSPTPVTFQGRVAGCCGTFGWIDAKHLLVFDDPAGRQTGAWVVDSANGARTYVSAGFGLSSPSGLVAIPDRGAGTTDVRRLDGTLISTIHNGGVLTWISPDGTHVAWLEDLGITNISSLVPRTVKLWTAKIDGTDATPLLTFDAAAVQWLPDNRHIIALARAPDGSSAGIWSVDTTDGTNAVVARGTFLQSLRLSLDGSRVAYLKTFSGSATGDGVWVANANGSSPVHLRETGAFRWADGSTRLWFLKLAAAGGGNDQLLEVDIANDLVTKHVDLDGRVLNDDWEVSPDGHAVAFWNEKDQAVILQTLTP